MSSRNSIGSGNLEWLININRQLGDQQGNIWSPSRNFTRIGVCKIYILNTKPIWTNCISWKVWDYRFWKFLTDCRWYSNNGQIFDHTWWLEHHYLTGQLNIIWHPLLLLTNDLLLNFACMDLLCGII